MRLWTHTIGWWTWIFWAFGRISSTEVPACHRCGWIIRLQRVGGLVLTIVIAVLFLFYVWPSIEEIFAAAIRKWIAMIMILICLSPYWLWEIFFPPAIDLTAFSDSIDYEFRDEEYAYEFAELNNDAEWVKVE